MAINASNNSTPREPIPAGNYAARCVAMIHIGTVEDTIPGKAPQMLNKVRLTWELPTELKVFKDENGPEPLVISKEYTLSMNEKANLRKDLKSWRGKDFTDKEAQSFDITILLGKACMLNIIHKRSADGSKVYDEIAGVTNIPKGLVVPAQINLSKELNYDAWDNALFESLPDFIKNKIRSSVEFKKMQTPQNIDLNHADDEAPPDGFTMGADVDDLPF